MAGNGKVENLRPPWPKGQSGNPGGRPNKNPFTDAYRLVAELSVKELAVSPTDTVAIAVAKVTVREALKGKVSAAAEAANRAEGTPTQKIQHEGTDGEPIKYKYNAAEFVEKLREVYGLGPSPEDGPPKES